MKKLILSVTAIVGLSMACEAQTGDYLYSGSEQSVTLGPGIYDITAYGAAGGGSVFGSFGGFGAEMEAQFSFAAAVKLTILVGGGGGYCYSGGGGGGGFNSNGSDASSFYGYSYGGSGGSSFLGGGVGGSPPPGQNGGTGGYGGGGGGGQNGGGGGGGYSGGGGGGGTYSGGGGGGGSYIDSSAIASLTEISGIASPDDSPNGEVFITAVPEPTTLAWGGLGGLLSLVVFRQRR